MKRYLDKLNAEGKYTEFPGVTVIAKTSNKDSDVWKKIHSVLIKSPLVSYYFSPLPWNSYHMTAINLYTEMGDGGENWEQFVNDKLPMLSELSGLLERHKFSPQISLKAICTKGVIQLQVEIPREQREVIERVAEAFNLGGKVPKEMHITLAYQYRLVTGGDSEKIRQYLEEEFQQIFAEHPLLLLEAPMLTYFKSMEKFKPWDARANPFISKLFYFFNCLHKPQNEPRNADPQSNLKMDI